MKTHSIDTVLCYDVIKSPSGAWLKVPYMELVDTGFETRISKQSYRNRQFAWLDFQQDAGLFLTQLATKGHEVKLTTYTIADFKEYMANNHINFRFI